ncbi:MAG: hypothetical protein CMH65_00740 [Nevskiales bacterium]|nr:hypothetical protein [Nevskiales bacterium]
MKPATQTTFAERAGRTLGRMWRGFVRLDRKACGWLVAQGLPVGLAKAFLWIVKLAVLGVLLYSAFWLALLLVFSVVAAWVARHDDTDQEEPQPEWREGPNGFGLYDKSDWRIDPHVTDDD